MEMETVWNMKLATLMWSSPYVREETDQLLALNLKANVKVLCICIVILLIRNNLI